MTFHDSTKKYFFSKHQNKAEFKNPDYSEVHRSNFPGLGTSAASLPHWPLQPHWPQQPPQPNFIKALPDFDGWIIPGTKITNTVPFLWNGSPKIQFITDT